jgi:hypothetical protein
MKGRHVTFELGDRTQHLQASFLDFLAEEASRALTSQIGKCRFSSKAGLHLVDDVSHYEGHNREDEYDMKDVDHRSVLVAGSVQFRCSPMPS